MTAALADKIPRAYLAALAAKAATALPPAAAIAPGARTPRAARPSQAAAAATMPDLEGLSMKDAQARLAAARLTFEFTGTGVALDQRPRAFETLEPGTVAKVRFGLERERMRSMAGHAGLSPDRTMELTDGLGSPLARSKAATSATLEADMAKTPLLRLSGRGPKSLNLPAATVTASRVPAVAAENRPKAAAAARATPATAPATESDAAVLNGPEPDGGRSAWATAPKPTPAAAVAATPAGKRPKPAAKIPVARRGTAKPRGTSTAA